MGVILGDGSELVWSHELRINPALRRGRTGGGIMLPLDSDSVAQMRRLLMQSDRAHRLPQLSDSGVIEEVRQLIEVSRLYLLDAQVATRSYRAAAAGGAAASSSAAASPPPPPPPPPASAAAEEEEAEEEEEEDTFPSTVDQACLAETIAAASEAGTALCEECAAG